MNVISLVQVKPELLADVILRRNEAHGKDYEVSGPFPFGTLDGTWALGGNFDVLGDQAFDITIVVTDELLGHDGVDAGVLAEDGLDLGVAVVNAEDARPLGPRVVRCTLHGRLRHELEIGYRLAPVAHGGSNTIGARVTASDHDDVLPGGSDKGVLVPLRFQGSLLGHEEALLVLREELHGKVNALEVAARNGQVTRLGSADGEGKGVVVGPELVDVDVTADIGVRNELNALLSEKVDAAVDGLLLELHVGDAVHEKTPDAIGPLVDGDLMTHLVELVGCGKAGGSRSHNSDCHSSPILDDARLDQAIIPGPVNDGIFNVLDGDRTVDEAGDARALAGCGADTSGELWEVVGLVQPIDGVGPLSVVDQIVPLRDEVIDRTARLGLAKGSAAVHATGGLDLALDLGMLLFVGLRRVELLPVHEPLQWLAVGLRVALVVEEAPELLDGLIRPIPTLHHGLVVVVVDALPPFLTGLLDLMSTILADGAGGGGSGGRRS